MQDPPEMQDFFMGSASFLRIVGVIFRSHLKIMLPYTPYGVDVSVCIYSLHGRISGVTTLP